MKRKALAAIALMVAGISTSANGHTLKKIMSTGSDEPNYAFFAISGALLTDRGEVIVADSKGSCVRKYDPHGRFIKESCRLGQGPEEFGDLMGGMCLAENIYVLDTTNRRIAELDHELNFCGYFRLPSNCRHLLRIGQLFYSSRFDPVGHVCEIIGFDENANIRTTFLRQGPKYLEKVKPGKMAYPIKLMFSSVNMHGSRESKDIFCRLYGPGSNHSTPLLCS